jgi:hypothetical protein
MYQTSGHAQITAELGLAAQTASKPLYPSSVSASTDTAGSTMNQTPGNAQITARPGPTAKHAD